MAKNRLGTSNTDIVDPNATKDLLRTRKGSKSPTALVYTESLGLPWKCRIFSDHADLHDHSLDFLFLVMLS